MSNSKKSITELTQKIDFNVGSNTKRIQIKNTGSRVIVFVRRPGFFIHAAVN